MMRACGRALLGLLLVLAFWGAGPSLACAQSAPQPAASAPAAATADSSAAKRRAWADLNSYKLGPGDVIDVYVYGEPELTRSKIQLSSSGTIAYPFGNVDAVGSTPSQLESAIENGLKQGYLVDPRVSVVIDQYRPFFIYGEVKKPGGYPFQPGLNVRKAVTLAGGFTERADQDKIYIVRENDPHNTAHKIGLSGQVMPGDTLTVEESFF
jgi:polysaccharide export outer membrane protein